MVAKSCKIKKVVHFTYFDKKNTHISGYKIVHKCTSATITVHIWTVIVALTFNILLSFSLSPSPHCLFFSLVLLTLTSLSFYLWSLTLNHRSPKQAIEEASGATFVFAMLLRLPPNLTHWCKLRSSLAEALAVPPLIIAEALFN